MKRLIWSILGLVVAVAVVPACGDSTTTIVATTPSEASSVGRFVYATQDSGSVCAFTVDTLGTGSLTPVAAPPAVGAVNALGVVADPESRFLYVASFGGEISVFQINQSTGALTAVGSPVSCSGSARGLAMHPSGGFLYANSSAGVDAFSIDPETGALTSLGPAVASVGFGYPAIHPSGTFLFVPGFGTGSVVSVYSINASTGVLTEHAGSPFSMLGGSGGLQCVVHPTANLLFVPCCDHGEVCVFSIAANGALTEVSGSPFATGGTSNWGSAVDPLGSFLYFVDDVEDDVHVFAINRSTGALTLSGTFTEVAIPVYVAADPSGNYLYVTNYDDHDITAYAIDRTIGSLSELPGSRFPASSTGLRGIVVVK